MFAISYEWDMDTDGGGAGWSENFWTAASTLAGALSAADSLAPYLAAVHSNEARLRTYHVTDTPADPGLTTPRLTTSRTYNDSGHFLNLRYDGMYPTTAARLGLFDTNGRSHDVWLKGMPDGIDVKGKKGILPIWQLKMGALTSRLVNPVANIVRRHLDYAQAKKPVKAISQTGVVTCVGHGYTENNVVRIGKTFSTPNIDGVYRVAAIAGSADTFQLVGFPPVASPPVTSKSSYAMRQLFVTTGLAAVEYEAITKKNVGRQRGGPRGRQKTPKN